LGLAVTLTVTEGSSGSLDVTAIVAEVVAVTLLQSTLHTTICVYPGAILNGIFGIPCPGSAENGLLLNLRL